MKSCIFCDIAKGKSPAHIIWESDTHLAFLSIYPNTEGFTVVIPKKHFPSYGFNLKDKDYIELLLAAKKVGILLDRSFIDVGRTAMMMEGFGVDHVHIKLFPMHGTNQEKWIKREYQSDKHFEVYKGYISSHDGPRLSDKELAITAKKIRSSK